MIVLRFDFFKIDLHKVKDSIANFRLSSKYSSKQSVSRKCLENLVIAACVDTFDH